MIELIIRHEFTPKQIENLLCSALEGGSNYWAKIVGKKAPVNFDNTPEEENRKFTHIAFPMNEGGELQIQDLESSRDDSKDKNHVLNLHKIKVGLKRMAKLYPKQFQNIVNDNYDADEADIFFQLAVLGECVYG